MQSIYLSTYDLQRLKAIHDFYKIPALSLGLVKPVLDEDDYRNEQYYSSILQPSFMSVPDMDLQFDASAASPGDEGAGDVGVEGLEGASPSGRSGSSTVGETNVLQMQEDVGTMVLPTPPPGPKTALVADMNRVRARKHRLSKGGSPPGGDRGAASAGVRSGQKDSAIGSPDADTETFSKHPFSLAARRSAANQRVKT